MHQFFFLYAGDALLAKSKEELQKMVCHSDNVCRRRILKLNVNEIKMLVFERDGISKSNIGLHGENWKLLKLLDIEE